MTLKMRIERAKCRGHGLCALAAPDIFEVVGLGMVRAADCDLTDGATLAAAQRAARYCCEDVIVLEEQD